MARKAYKPERTAFLSWDGVATEVDVISQWVDTSEAVISEHKVETGATITDHVSVQPRVLVVSCAVTNSPILGGTLRSLAGQIPESAFEPTGLFFFTYYLGKGLDAAVGAVKSLAGLAGADVPSGFSTWQDYPETDNGNGFHDLLLKAQKDALICSLTIGVSERDSRVYENLIIQGITKTVSEETGDLSNFEISLREISIVETGLVTLLPVPSALAEAVDLASEITGGAKPTGKRKEEDLAEEEIGLFEAASIEAGF
jgi:hypothetical protein